MHAHGRGKESLGKESLGTWLCFVYVYIVVMICLTRFCSWCHVSNDLLQEFLGVAIFRETTHVDLASIVPVNRLEEDHTQALIIH